MTDPSETRLEWIRSQVRRFAEHPLPGRPVLFEDTSDFMSIERGHIIDLRGKLFLVRCNEREGRFTLDDQPKFWVKRVVALDTGQIHIIKLAIREEFTIRIGTLRIRCVRSEEKEGEVLKVVKGDSRFMQGRSIRDVRGNLVRVIDFIRGTDLLSHVHSLDMSHESYFHSRFPGLLARTMESIRAIHFLHQVGLCHGDIRNDHILIERDTGRFRWIDFDLTQDFPDFDVWSIGNILHCIVGKGLVTFREVVQGRPELSGQLTDGDASVFFPHRVMNLRKIYPYLPAGLNKVLMRFSASTQLYYEKLDQVLDDLADCAGSEGWPITPDDNGDVSPTQG